MLRRFSTRSSLWERGLKSRQRQGRRKEEEDQSSHLLPKHIQATARKIATVAAALSPADALHFTIYQNDETLEIKIRRSKSLFFMGVFLKNEGAGTPTPSPKTTEESYTLFICQNQGPAVTPCAVIFSVTDAVAKSSRGSDASNFVQIMFAVFAIPESGSEKTTSLTV